MLSPLLIYLTIGVGIAVQVIVVAFQISTGHWFLSPANVAAAMILVACAVIYRGRRKRGEL